MTDTLAEETPAQEHEHAAPAAAGRWLRGRLAKTLMLLVAVTGLAAPLIGLEVHRNPALSPYDEVSYLDYLYRVDHGLFVVGKGDKVSVYTTRVVACLGVQGVVPPDPAVCHGTEPAVPKYLDTADIDPPTYYVLTAIGAGVIRWLGVTRSLLVSGRLMGIAWAGLGLTLLILFARRLRATWTVAAVVAGLVLCMPLYLRMWTFLSPHAMELIVTISVLWVAVNWAEGGGRWWHLALVGLVPPAVKATDVLAVGLAVLMLLFCAYRAWVAGRRSPDLHSGPGSDRGPDDRAAPSTARLMTGAAILFASTLVASIVWLAVRSHYSIMAGNEFPQFDVTHFALTYLTSTVAIFMQPQLVLADNQLSVAVLLQLALFGSVLVALRSTRPPTIVQPLSGALLVGGIFGPWLFVLFNYVVLSQFVTGLPIRYGLSVFSGAAAVLAVSIRTRIALAAILCLGLVLLSIDLFPSHWPT